MKKGSVVKVWNHTMGGKRVFEGEATIVALEHDDTDYPDERIWSVHFKDDAKGDNYNRKQNNMELVKE